MRTIARNTSDWPIDPSLDTLCERYRRLYLSAVCDALFHLGMEEKVLPSSLRPLDPLVRIVCEAFTVEGHDIPRVGWEEGIVRMRPYLEVFERLTPDSVLVLISATHGVEGFCGAGCQVGYLVDRLYGSLPPTTRTILIHALNPHGFAWLRRVNENNIDLNRNFQDFTQPLPDSSPYEAIHDWLIPDDWDGNWRRAADAALQKYIRARGMLAFQAAVCSMKLRIRGFIENEFETAALPVGGRVLLTPS